MRLHHLLFLAGVGMFVFADVAAAQEAPDLENIALGASYTLDPRPGYKHCTDKGDATQLTDGVYSEGYFWVQPSTVGWQNVKPALVLLDLGEVRAIRGVSYNTAAGAAGAEWPAAIGLYVGDDGKQFHRAGELVTLSAGHGFPAPETYGIHRYWTDALETYGRYVALAIYGAPFVFVDEIEVYAGDPAWIGQPRQGEFVEDIKSFGRSMLIQGTVKRRYFQDIQLIRKAIEEDLAPGAQCGGLLERLDALTREVGELDTVYDDTFRAILPFDALHARIFKVQAALWDVTGRGVVTAWRSPLWEALPHVSPPPEAGAAALDVHLMKNEYRAAALNLSNATQENLSCSVSITNLSGGPNPDYVTVHEVLWTDTSGGTPVAAALPEAAKEDSAFAVTLPAGLTRQLWFTFHPVDVDPGTYKGAVQFHGPGFETRVPLTMKVYPFTMPDKPTLHFGGWDYTDGIGHRAVTAENREALVAHLRERFVDSPWATSRVMPRGKYGDDGHLTGTPSTAAFNEWLALWPDAAQYLVFVNVPGKIDRWAMDAPEFDVAVGEWTRFWAGYLRDKGIDPAQLGLLLVDEPHAPEQDAIILAWAKAIHAADTGIRVWEDPVYRDMNKANQDMVAACDVLCPNRPIFFNAPQSYRDYHAERQKDGIALEFYSCSGPARLLDPYRYYRLQAWDCWRFGGEGTYFWAFADASGGSSWNEYTAKRPPYTLSFIDKDSVVAGKQMEACREGIEDYEYFAMLERAISEAEAQGKTGPELDGAKKLLSEGPERVCTDTDSKSYRWHEPGIDRSLADATRIEVLEVLTSLL